MSLPSLYATEGPYLRLVRARACRYVATRITTDACVPAPSLLCGPQNTQSVRQQTRRPPSVGLQRTHEPSVRSEGERHVTHASTRLCPLCMTLGTHNCATSSPPSQSQSSTDSRSFCKERGRETRHARQHASLPSLHAAGVYIIARIPLSCVVRRYLYLEYNKLVALPAEVFNGLTNLG
jgi:hypothetical protein